MDTLLSSFISDHENDDLKKLALQANLYPDIDISFAIRQIKGRQIAHDKIPTWYVNRNIEYPLHLSLEQSSSEATAKFKASLFKGKSMLDLTGGMGVDFYFIGQNFDSATYVESQPELVKLARKNFDTLHFSALVYHADAITYLKSANSADLIYIDPARRNMGGKKTVRIEDCTPNIIEVEHLLDEKAQTVAIKLSPMLDISLALQSLHHVSDVCALHEQSAPAASNRKISKLQIILVKLCLKQVYFSRGCKSLMHGVVPEALASRKLVVGDDSSEGSETAKSGTDEQKRYMRHNCLG